MNKTELLLAEYRKYLTPQYYEHIGSDWSSSPTKVEAAKKHLIKLAKLAQPNIAGIRHNQFIKLMLPATPLIQYNNMNQPELRPKVQKKISTSSFHATPDALQKAEQIKRLADKYIKSEYAKQYSNITEAALNLLIQRLQEIEAADTLDEKAKQDTIKLLFLL
jgi:hypothetical protein